MSELLEAAVAACRRGWRVIPLHTIRDGRCTCGAKGCAKPAKHPTRRRTEATLDDKLVEVWIRTGILGNLGICTGETSGIVVLDVDKDRGGFDTLDRMVDAVGPVPETYTVATGGGGLHLYFRYTPDLPVGTTGFRPGLDLRSDRNLVVAPPSLHQSGNLYRVLNEAPLAPADWLINLVQGAGGPFDRVLDARGPFKMPETIEAGRRDDTLFRYASSLRAMGLEREPIEAALREAWLRCEQPEGDLYPLAEAIAKAHNVVRRYEAGDTRLMETQADVIVGRRFDEYGLCQAVREELTVQEDVPPVSTLGDVWWYDTRRWRSLGDHGVMRLFDRWAQQVHLDHRGKPKFFRPRTNLLSAVWRMLLLTGFDSEFFETRNAGGRVGFDNGTLLVNGELVPHAPEHRLRYIHNMDYDPAAPCPRWSSFLEETFDNVPDTGERISALQEFVGAALFGVATHYQKGLILLGSGANGKSVILDVVTSIMPPMSVVAVAPHEMVHEYAKARLAGALLNCVSEMPAKELMESEPIKQAIDGTTQMEGRHPYGKRFNFHPIAAHIFAANYLPETRDYSHAMQRRWLLIMTPNRIPPEHQVPNLSRIIIDSEIQGILAWAARGAKRLTDRGGYGRVASSEVRVDEWRRDNDQVAQFCIDRLRDPEGDNLVPLTTIYQAYSLWALDTGHARMHKNRFSRRLADLDWQKVRRSEGVCFRCVLQSSGAFNVPS